MPSADGKEMDKCDRTVAIKVVQLHVHTFDIDFFNFHYDYFCAVE